VNGDDQMSEQAVPANSADLALILDVPTLVGTDLREAVGAFLNLAESVAAAIAPDLKVSWQVRTIRMASPLNLVIEPVARQNRADVLSREAITRGVVSGLAAVQSGEDRPEFLSDEALRSARTLSRLTRHHGHRLTLAGAGQSAEVTMDLARRVDEILEPAYVSGGSVEGYLETLNVHANNRYFAVYDDLTGERVECRFTRRRSLEEIGKAVEKRVLVEGDIHYRRSGTVAWMAVESMEVFPDQADLPTAEQVLGILRP
jgi:hypothetical protein